MLLNLAKINSAEELALAEADLANARIVQLMDSGSSALPDSRDFQEISAIHFHLFQDIYGWAGKLRTIDMNRAGGHFFAPCGYLRINLDHLTVELKEKNFLRLDDRNEFIQELAYFYDLLNWIHPFREGNGRTQRLFWSRVSADAGWILDWRPIQRGLNEASQRAREDEDFEMLHVLLEKAVSQRRN